MALDYFITFFHFVDCSSDYVIKYQTYNYDYICVLTICLPFLIKFSYINVWRIMTKDLSQKGGPHSPNVLRHIATSKASTVSYPTLASRCQGTAHSCIPIHHWHTKVCANCIQVLLVLRREIAQIL